MAVIYLVFYCDTAFSAANWQLKNTWPKVGALRGITFCNDRFVATGDGGIMLTSPDGLDWTSQHSGTTDSIYATAYGNGIYAAVGVDDISFGTVLTSSNAVDWEPRPLGINGLYGIAYGNGRFVAVGGFGTVYVSTDDGLNWAPRNSGTLNSLYGITYAEGYFVAVGLGPTIAISSDGFTWSTRTGTGDALYSIAYGNGRFVAAGGSLFVSLDALSWSMQLPNGYYEGQSITFGNGMFLALAFGDNVFNSTDGFNWVQRDLDAEALAVGYGNGRFIAVGADATMLGTTNLNHWTDIASPYWDVHFDDVAYGNGTFLAVANNPRINAAIFVTSSNRAVWSSPVIQTNMTLSGITFGSNIFLALGTDQTGPTAVLISSNALDWERHRANEPFLRSPSYANGFFFANPGYISTDGTNWASLGLPPEFAFIGNVVYGEGVYAAVAEDNYSGDAFVFISPDATNWTSHLLTLTEDPTELAFGNGLFVSSALFPGIIMSATNAIDWRRRYQSLSQLLFGITYGAGSYVCVGQSPDEAIVLTSTTGTNWVRSNENDEVEAALNLSALNSVTYGEGTFVAVGRYGTILQWDKWALPQLQIQADPETSQLSVTLSGEPGFTYRIQGSTNLNISQWTDLFPITLEDSSVTVPLSRPAENPCQFYRAVRP